MQRLALSLALLVMAASAFAQSQAPSPFYPAPPPEQAPKVDQGAPLGNLSSPLSQDQQKVARTIIDSDAEAQLFAGAVKVVWGRYAKINFRRSGKSQVWRLAEGDNPCDGARENFDLVYEKSVEKKPVPTQPKRG